jgi:hypothetical protein
MPDELENKSIAIVNSDSSDITEGEQKGKPQWFKPGQSGNPAGKPKGALSITAAMRRRLDEEVTLDGGEKKKYLDLLVAKTFDLILREGDSSLLKELWHYIDGMPAQSIKLGGELNLVETPFSEAQFKEILQTYVDSSASRKIREAKFPEGSIKTDF